MQRLVMFGKEERKGGLVGGLVFGGLRANPRNRRFARNGSLDFTGRFAKTEICP